MTDRELDRALLKALGYRVEVRRHGKGAFTWGDPFYVVILPSGEYASGSSDFGGWGTEESAWATLPALDTWEGAGKIIDGMAEKGYHYFLRDYMKRHDALFQREDQNSAAEGIANTGPRAIRLAALRATGVTVDG